MSTAILAFPCGSRAAFQHGCRCRRCLAGHRADLWHRRERRRRLGLLASAPRRVIAATEVRRAPPEVAPRQRDAPADRQASKGGAHIPAERTRKAIAWLVEHGYTRARIATEIGAHPSSPLAQGERVTVRTADRVRRLYEHEQARVHGATRACPRCHISHEDDPIAAAWCRLHARAPLTREERLT